MANHRWTGWELLDEPGISDVDHGQWGRAHVVCERCGEERDVWRFVTRDSIALLAGCPVVVVPVPAAPRWWCRLVSRRQRHRSAKARGGES